MSHASNWLETAIINHFFRNSAVSAPSGLYLALFTTTVTEAGAGTEVAGGSYARQAITFGAPSDGVASNTAALTFTAMPACTVVAGGIFDALSGGNMLGANSFSSARAVTAGANFIVPIGEVVLTVR